jgi:ABC-2 type transport system permease protein
LASTPDTVTTGRPRQRTIFRIAARTGLADFRYRYTWKSWAFGWLLRCLFEVTFFGLIGVVLNSRQTGLYLLVGRAFYLGVQEVMWVIQSTAWERGSGTLPLLVSAPGRVWAVFAGRSTQWIPSAIATSLIALFTIAPAFGLRYTGSGVITALISVPVVVLSSYGFALPIAALVLRRPAWRNLASNVAHGVMGLVCGVFVPVVFWPTWVQVFAQVFPVTHALDGLRRGLAAGGTVADALPGLGIAAGAGLCWLLIGALLLEQFAEGARRDGSIDLDS